MDRGVPPLGAWRVTVETPDFSVPRDGSAAPTADATVPLSEFAAYAPGCERVFVTEYRINVLTLPECIGSLAIFGGKNSAAGNGVHQVKCSRAIKLGGACIIC